VERLFALADQIDERYTKAKADVENLTQSILAKAFRGELSLKIQTTNLLRSCWSESRMPDPILLKKEKPGDQVAPPLCSVVR